MSQQYYAHFEYLSKGEKRNLNTLTINSSQMVVMSNDSSIQIYEYTPQGLTFNRTVKLHCAIKKLLVLPNKHQNSDYVFILDSKGRYAFWQPDGGFQLVQNQINNQQLHLDIYKQSSYVINKSQFCSETHHFEVLDTKGTIFFNVGQEITLIDYNIKSTGLKVQKAKRIKLEIIKYCFAGWIQNAKHEKWLGLIEEIEEKTILKVHNLDKLMRVCRENEIFSLQRTNLLQFSCPANGKLLILTLNEITLIQVPSLHVISSYSVKDRLGKLLTVSPELYGYIGEQLILFSGSIIKSFGSLSLNGQNILASKGIAQVKLHRDLQDGGKLISIVTMTNQILLVVLYENLWKLCCRMECLNPIYSLHQMNNQTFVAVMSKGADNYQVAIIERETVVPSSRQQKYDIPVQRMTAINSGNGLLVSSKVGVLLLNYNRHSLMFESTLISIPDQELIIANDFFCVTNKAIYRINQAEETKQILHASQIVIAATQNNNILFLNAELNVMSFNYESNKVQHVRSATQTEYAWHLVNQTLLAFQSDDIQHFYVFEGSEFITKIKMQHAAIVSSITHQMWEKSTILVIGFVDGFITVIKLQNYETITSFQNYANQPISLQIVQNSIIASSKTKQFLLKLNANPTLQRIRLFSNNLSPQCLTYLQAQKQLLFVQKYYQQTYSIIKTVSVDNLLQTGDFFINNSYDFKKKILTSFTQQIPVVFIEKNFIYIAVPKQIHIYNAVNFHCDQLINNYYADVIGIERVEYGILIYGIDELSRNILTLLQPNTNELLSTITLILKDNRYIKSIKSLSASSNRLICRAERFTSIYEISDIYELTELNQFTTDLNGYFLDIDPIHQIFSITDSYRFAAFYSYNDTIVPVSRFVSQVQINELALLDRAVVVADRSGKMCILEYNVQNENAPMRMLMTEVVSFDVGSEVTNLTKISPHEVMYTSAGGKIGVIKVIEAQVFKVFKEMEGQMLQDCQKRSGFGYKKWKNRDVKDKLIDFDLVIEYQQERSKRGIKKSSNEIEILLKVIKM